MMALQHAFGNIDVNAGAVVYDFDPNSWNVIIISNF